MPRRIVAQNLTPGHSDQPRELTQSERDAIDRVLNQPGVMPTPGDYEISRAHAEAYSNGQASMASEPPLYHDPGITFNTADWPDAIRREAARPQGWSITLNPTPSFVKSKYGRPSQQLAKEEALTQMREGVKANIRRINSYLDTVAEDRKLIAQVEAMVASDEPAEPEPASQPVEPTPDERAITDWLEARQEYVNEGELDARRTLASEVTSEIP